MILSASLQRIFDKFKVAYQIQQPYLDSECLRVQLLQSSGPKLMAIYPAGARLNLKQVSRLYNKAIRALEPAESDNFFKDCEAGMWPALALAYGVKEVLIDSSLKSLPYIYTASGSSQAMLRLARSDFLRLNPRAKYGNLCERGASKVPNKTTVVVSKAAGLDPLVWQLINALGEALVEPESAAQSLAKHPTLNHDIVASFIELCSIENSSNHRFTKFSTQYIQGSGQNLVKYWQHAILAAQLAKHLAEQLHDNSINPITAYVAGATHNLGLLLLMQLFAPEYSLLARWVELYPNTPISVLEARLLGLGTAFYVLKPGHAELGAKMLRAWNMPETFCLVAKEHHTVDYCGPKREVVELIQLVNQLLRRQGVGDGNMLAISPVLLEKYRIDSEEARLVLPSSAVTMSDIYAILAAK